MAPELRALLVDYGGVLTNPLHHVLEVFCRDLDLDGVRVGEVVREMYGDAAVPGILTALETGEMHAADFEIALAARLMTRAGEPVEAVGLLNRMFAGFEREPRMLEVVLRARAAGIKTVLVSNSWGTDFYPREGFDELFDAVVISGEVGLRKPDPAIYRYAAAQVGVPPEHCVFVDDMIANVSVAVAVGMCGIHHVDLAQTVTELQAVFGGQFIGNTVARGTMDEPRVDAGLDGPECRESDERA